MSTLSFMNRFSKIMRRMTKILVVSPYFYPNIEWGGPVTLSWNLARALHDAGSEAQVLTTDVSISGHSFKTKVLSGVKIIYAKNIWPKGAWNFRFFLSFDQIFKGWKLIPEFDIIHFQDVFILQNFALSIFCRLNKVPYVITTHGNLSFDKTRSKSFVKRFFYLLFGKYYLNGASKIIAVSEAEKRYIRNHFPELAEKTIFIPHIVKREKYKSIDIRKRFDISGKKLIVLYIGRIYSLKGVKELLLGFKEFLEKGKSGAVLIIAGPDAGGLSEIRKILGLSDKLKRAVILAGKVDGDLKYSLLMQTDVVALLSRSETIPTSLVEAASFAKTIICTKECNLQDLVNCGGALLSTRDASDISGKFSKLAISKSLLRMTGEKAKEWFRENYDYKKTIITYNKVYEDAIKNL
jgi:glycosyltransferase involved in cell wall biosynthesis